MMHTRILVAYATTFGSTAEIAEAIGAALRHDHTEVDVREVLDVDDLRPYDAVVVGSAIYNGEWLPEAVQFVRLHEATLCRMPVAYFAACMIVQRPTPQHQRTARLYVDAVQQTAPSIQPVTWAYLRATCATAICRCWSASNFSSCPGYRPAIFAIGMLFGHGRRRYDRRCWGAALGNAAHVVAACYFTLMAPQSG